MAELSAIVWLAAAVPALAWACLLWLLTGSGVRRAPVLVTALLTGALLAAWPASHINRALFDEVAAVSGSTTAQYVVPATIVPVVEELAKAAVIAVFVLLAPGGGVSLAEGAVLGATVGLGFTGAENVQYLTLAVVQSGTDGLWRAAYVRALLGGLHHATFAAFVGVGFAYARRARTARGRWLGAALGLLAAVTQHVVWNIGAAKMLTDVLCGAVQTGGTCTTAPGPVVLFIIAPLIALGPIVAAVMVLWLIIRRLATIDRGGVVRRCTTNA